MNSASRTAQTASGPDAGNPRPGGHVAILLASYDGAAFIDRQLASFLEQDHTDWSLWVGDDGSQDATRDRVRAFASRAGARAVTVLDGPRRGSFQNFMQLLCNPGIDADFVALSDQDDAWLPQHLSRALAQIAIADDSRPVLYGGRTIVTDDRLERRGTSPLFVRTPGFRNALVQNISGGNTMVLNRAARSIVMRAGPPDDAVCHDWWLYQLLSGAGARIIYDAEPTVLYRQHGGNQIGSNLGRLAQLNRIAGLVGGRYRNWNLRNLAALEGACGLLTEENAGILEGFARLRSLRGSAAVRTLRDLGLYRQTAAGQLSLKFAAWAGLL
ncbi:MAG: glycosyltransferase [Rhodobacteraceae bacterium]|nr:glycosyltransferase [Paracoccaceae bacterium]